MDLARRRVLWSRVAIVRGRAMLRWVKDFAFAVGALAFLLWPTDVVAGPAYYQPTTDLTALTHYGTASPSVLHAFVSSVSYSGNQGGGAYTWHASCPGSPDGTTYVSATGMASGCWVLEGFAPFDGNIGFVDAKNTWTKSQRGQPATLSLSGSTATPNFDNAQNFVLTLVHGTCAPCTIANPSTTLVPGQAGVFRIIQSATGGDTLTWGSSFKSAGGVATLTLSSAANANDYLSYYVDSSSNIILSLGVSNATH